jgi:hypothetical protein
MDNNNMSDDYIFIPGLDQPGNDSIQVDGVAFNTLGVFKSAITSLVPGSGIHIKKDIYNQYLNNNKWKKKEQVKGIILIVSCQKYLQTRVNDFKLSKLEYSGWKVVTIIGNKDLETETKYEEKENINLLTIKCEDTYLHLLKKLVLSMKYLQRLFDIKEGILRLGDDIEIMEDKMENFLLNVEKKDYMGWCGYYYPNNEFVKKYPNNFMVGHYMTHLEELKDISFSGDQIRQLNVVPTASFNVGTIVYFSLKSCKCLVDEMEKMNWDVLYYDELYGYVNIIEDMGVGCLLFNNDILPTMHIFHIGSEQVRFGHTDATNVIGQHTNKYKEE